MLPPIYANFEQFSEIIKYKMHNLQFYTIKYLEYNAICVIVQDWINPKNMITFYTIHSKLTNSISFIIFCKNLLFTTLNCKKTEERAKYIRNVHDTSIGFIDIRELKMGKLERWAYCYTKHDWLRPKPDFRLAPKLYIDFWYYEEIRRINWIMRDCIAIFSAGLVHYLNKHKIRTNKAGQVFFNRRFNKHISKYL